MPAYWIAHVTVTDPDAYKGYQSLAPAAFAKYGATFLAHGGASENPEGAQFDRHVLIAFADLATAKACYASPEYQAARQQRLAAAVVMITIVEGL
jgi:uncharacterized protein (DUF1330 family)